MTNASHSISLPPESAWPPPDGPFPLIAPACGPEGFATLGLQAAAAVDLWEAVSAAGVARTLVRRGAHLTHLFGLDFSRGDTAQKRGRIETATTEALQLSNDICLALSPDLSSGQVEASVDAATHFAYRFGDPHSRRLQIAAGAHADVVACARAQASCVNFARDLIIAPANTLGPADWAPRLRAAFGSVCDIEEFDFTCLREMGAGALLAVGAGAAQERLPRLICLTYVGDPTASHVALVGKSVCFDAGGINLKPSAGLWSQKGDMAGGAVAVATVLALAQSQAKVRVSAILPAADNVPDGAATRPGDVCTTLSGRSVEIVDTDYEGRLVLADGMTFALQRFTPSSVVCVGTLSNAVVEVLGRRHGAYVANDEHLVEALEAASRDVSERLVRFPLSAHDPSALRSDVADLRNMPTHDDGAFCYAGQFLAHFAEGTPWAHIDLLGPALAPRRAQGAWATGWGVRLLRSLVLRLAKSRPAQRQSET